MYGSVHWERKCRRHLSDSLLEFLREFGEDESKNHECIQCFRDDDVSCTHVCCRQKAIEFARNKAIKILPLCPFAKSVFDKTPEYQDLL